MSAHPSNSTGTGPDPTPQDDAAFAGLVQNVKLSSNDPSSFAYQVEVLEAAKTQLEQDANSQDAWDKVANTFQSIADAAREEAARTPIGESAVVSLIVSIQSLNKQRQAPVDIQAMRAFANICVDHEANRQKVLQENGFEVIVEVLKHTSHGDAIKTACGALLNTTMSYEPAQSKVVELGAIEQLLKVLKSDITENEMSITIAARVIANLSEIDSGSQSVIKSDGHKIVVHLLLQTTSKEVEDYMDLIDYLTDILSAVISKESAQIAIQQSGLLPPLLDILEHSGTSDEGKTEEEKKEDDKKFGEIKASLVEVVVSTTLADANMVPVFNDKEIMDRFLAWLQLSDREDLQTCAALCIGNVARSDQHCVKLVHEYHAVEPLIHVVRKATDLKASHAATGVLRNLALPEKNREILGDAGVIQACSPLLKKDNALPLQANIVGILKRLSLSSSNTVRIISGREPFETLSSTSDGEGELETPLSTLVELIGRTDDFALKSEGTRTLCNMIKVTWGNESMRGFDAASVTALQQTLNKPDVALQIVAMTRNPKYVVLQNEGVIALTLLVTSPAQAEKNAVLEALVAVAADPQPVAEATSTEEGESQEQPPKELTLLESLLGLIKNQDGKCPDEVRTNVCVFLRNALDSAAREGEDPAYLAFLKSSGMKGTLEEVKAQEGTRPLVRSGIQEVLSRLE
ncbi:hypothetical protein BGZ80_000351 [Entomortierella chlamydospora]|uniref:ARM repeat-containing protein n=1 Tax=Entomortierella chlamydospora TaxID=101097 RepID=A0A9P6N3L6_9FUNG|nr:hypothetical protein BGZ79_007976 [Entomortierella chlamydospora]KAG0022393.1 hypothetical protein BGZ80_000351 [Entomortierella chlamydospora]